MTRHDLERDISLLDQFKTGKERAGTLKELLLFLAVSVTTSP